MSACTSQVSLEVHTQYAEYLSSDADQRIRGVLRVTSEAATGPRQPFHLALVLDVSYSMQGHKIQRLREAARLVVQALVPGDLIHLISYNHAPTVIAQGCSQADTVRLLAAIDSLGVNGGTNIGAAITAASALLCQHSRPGEVKKRIFLYTDGQPGSGPLTADDFAAICNDVTHRDVSLSTFGIGEDVNGALLESLAEMGGGLYNFMSERRIEENTERALKALLRVIGARGRIAVKLRPHVHCVHPPHDAATMSRDGSMIDFEIGDIRSGNQHDAPFEFLVRACHGDSCLIGEATLSYQPLANPLSYFESTTPLAVSLRQQLQGPPIENPVVGAAFALIDMAQVNDRVVRMLEGDFTAAKLAEAITLLKGGIERLSAYREGDESAGCVETAVRRTERTLDRLITTSRNDSRNLARVALELNMQRQAFQRQSIGDFEASNSSNLTPQHRAGSGSFPDDDDLHSRSSPDDDDLTVTDSFLLIHTPPPQPIAPAPPANPLKHSAALLAESPDALPSEFFCPITKQLMDDPVVTADGHTYQRTAIQHWFAAGNRTSPVTNEMLAHQHLVANHAVRSMIDNWKP